MKHESCNASLYLKLLSPFLIIATINSSERIIFSPQEMLSHKQKCMQKMKANPAHIKNPAYQLNRALKSVAADDCDYIPKVPNAGNVFTNAKTPYQLMHNGVKVVLNCYYNIEWMTDVIFGLKGHHEPQEEKCFYEVLKFIPEGATMIELGSYWAYYSLWFATEIKNSTNFMIEPDPIRLEIGRKNFDLNNKKGFFKRGFLGVMKDNEPDINGTGWIAIDDFIAEQGIEHINILHSDIQGAEAEMLETTVGSLDKIDYFFISTHSLRNHMPCINFFKKHGFIILAEHHDYESCSGDGLIVAKRQGVPGPDQISIKKYN